MDAVIDELAPLLDEGDTIIDGGNSHLPRHPAPLRRASERGLRFLGVGVSGGEEGALHGPSIMPGGDEAAYGDVEAIFTTIAAQVDGTPCCTFVGPGGAGHYVKMVHNGIEYADMQLIAEAYDLLRHGVGLEVPEIAEVFRTWNEGPLESFLIEISATVLAKNDEKTGGPLIDVIVDEAEQKGTGRWTAQDALELGVPLTGITEAVFARTLSAQRAERVKAAGVLAGPTPAGDADRALVDDVATALYASKVVAYAQGFVQIAAASEEHGWGVDLGAMAMLWRGGCIIRARFLGRIREAYDADPHTHQPADGRAVHRRGRRRPGPVAAGGLHGRRARHPGAGVRVLARLLRRLPARARPGEPDPGPARPVRRPHLPAPGRRGLVPHPLGAGRCRSADRRVITAILCGGRGTRLQSHAAELPKPLVEIGGRPILWHVVRIYAAQGLRDFRLLTGYRSEQVEAFVARRRVAGGRRRALRRHRARHARPAGRLWRVREELGRRAVPRHLRRRRGRRRPRRAARAARRARRRWRPSPWCGRSCRSASRVLDGDGRVSGFQEKPRAEHWINGGFFAFEPGALDYLREDSVLEREPLERLAADGRLHAFRHEGFWACMDTYKDAVALNDLWAAGRRALGASRARTVLESLAMAGHSKWAGIKHKKAIVDARRGKLFTKLARAITVAAKEGGGDVEGNPALALAVQKAKDASMPKDNIERAIAKGTGEGGDADALEARHVRGLRPRRRRGAGRGARPTTATAPAPRCATSSASHGGNLGEPGSVAYLFDKKGVVVVDAERYSEDDLMAAIDAGAEDIAMDDDVFEVLTEPAALTAVRAALDAAGRRDRERRGRPAAEDARPARRGRRGQADAADRRAGGPGRRRRGARELRRRRRDPRARRRARPGPDRGRCSGAAGRPRRSRSCC